jgi:cysteine desulfurase family protein (TIGR01976 family)
MNLPTTEILDIDFVRSRFPALETDWALFDNGGGSQIVQPVLDRMREYLVSSNVQHGASYELSRVASGRLGEAQAAMATLINARDPSEVVMGGSTTLLLQTLAMAVSRTWGPGDEVVVSSGDHEANIAPWLELERVGLDVKFWELDPDTGRLRLDDLEELMGPRTRLVAVTHVSNILGTINPIREIADRVHGHGALICVDGVAFAPHRAVDVQALDVDFYAFSFYKTFGPHHALLYGRHDLLVELPSRSFFFIADDDVPYKLQPGGVNYELSYSMVGLLDYLSEVAGPVARGSHPESGPSHGRPSVEAAFARFAVHEEALAAALLGFLVEQPRVRVVGEATSDRNERVPVISFTVDGISSADVVRQVDGHRVAIRFGHFYSPRLIEHLGIDVDDGVVRVSMAHYNTKQEVDRLIMALEEVLV